jgi:hypothetical protein
MLWTEAELRPDRGGIHGSSLVSPQPLEEEEPPESPTEATEQPGRVAPQAQVEGAQEEAERVSWWRRVFGG